MSKHGRSWSSSDKEEAHPSWWGKQRKMEDRGYSAVDDTNDEEDNDLQPWWDEPTNSLPYLPTFRNDEDDYSNEAVEEEHREDEDTVQWIRHNINGKPVKPVKPVTNTS